MGLVGFAVPLRQASGGGLARRRRAFHPARACAFRTQPLVLNFLTDGELITSGDKPQVLS